MFKIAVCEDSTIELDTTMMFLKRYNDERPDRSVFGSGFETGAEMLKTISAGEVFDLYLLDIFLPEMDGIEIARALRETEIDAPIVFLTSSLTHALDAFDVQALQYLLKPITAESFFPVLDASYDKKMERRDGLMPFQLPEGTVKVPFSSIICVESAYRKHILYLADGRTLTSKAIRAPFREAIGDLLLDKRFLYAHKSFVINMDHVREITDGSFVMAGGIIIHIPRYRFTEAKSTYLNFLSDRSRKKRGQ